jgi:hypothetical protein
MALEMEVGVATGDMTYAASYKPLVIPAPPDAKVGTFTRTQLEAQATGLRGSPSHSRREHRNVEIRRSITPTPQRLAPEIPA